MSTIKTAILKSNELSEELDDASLQAITGGVTETASFAGSVSQASSSGFFLTTPVGGLRFFESQGFSFSQAATSVLVL